MKSKHKSRSPLTNVIRKPQVSHQGLLFHEIHAPASPSSKKLRETDMAKHISKKKKKSKVFISSESIADENEIIPETLEADHQKESSHPTPTDVIPPKDSVAKSVSEEARTFDIFVNISHMDANVTMGEDASHTGDQDSFMETEHESGGFGGTFENLEFDEEETDCPDHMIMTMKQFKILNTKLNSILQSHADLGGGNSVTSLEVDGLLKLLEGRITSKVTSKN
ncbi:unnamed protein product [Lactuca saligna]|uniref:Uncharacterized protein n=1 Tax=Lactuca saligna TaxID=75948 RepID=A0AA36DYV8_LACSI|nr:unnamed protein product [Lactuca saligna]